MPKVLRQLEMDPDVELLQGLLSANGYFEVNVPQKGLFEAMTHQATVLFQSQHLDQSGAPLDADGIVGGKTWWALENPGNNLVDPSDDPSDDVQRDDSLPVEWLVKGDDFPIVGRRFEREEFVEYVKWVQENEDYSWNPTGITMHHTGVPNLSQRPDGYTEQHMKNFRHHYRDTMGWGHGPHIFTDDHAIWVLNPLSIRGVHAVSYNRSRYGIEMLGNFNTDDDYSNDRGKLSRENGMFAAAVLMKHAGISTEKLNFHRHCPKAKEARKECPGTLIAFNEFEDEVLSLVENV